jgi:hypothetical protein
MPSQGLSMSHHSMMLFISICCFQALPGPAKLPAYAPVGLLADIVSSLCYDFPLLNDYPRT